MYAHVYVSESVSVSACGLRSQRCVYCYFTQDSAIADKSRYMYYIYIYTLYISRYTYIRMYICMYVNINWPMVFVNKSSI